MKVTIKIAIALVSCTLPFKVNIKIVIAVVFCVLIFCSKHFNSIFRYEIFETLTTKGLKSELVLREADRTDGQLYTCITENPYGKDERSIKLLVMGKKTVTILIHTLN